MSRQLSQRESSVGCIKPASVRFTPIFQPHITMFEPTEHYAKPEIHRVQKRARQRKQHEEDQALSKTMIGYLSTRRGNAAFVNNAEAKCEADHQKRAVEDAVADAAEKTNVAKKARRDSSYTFSSAASTVYSVVSEVLNGLVDRVCNFVTRCVLASASRDLRIAIETVSRDF